MSKTVGALMLEMGVLTSEQLNTALGRQRRYGGKLASICLQLGFADERALAVVLSRQLGVPFVVLSRCAIPVKITQTLAQNAATKLEVLPLRKQERTLLMAMARPNDIAKIDELRFGTGARIVEHGAIHSSLIKVTEEIYKLRQNRDTKLWVGDQVDASKVETDDGYLEIVRGDEVLHELPQVSPDAAARASSAGLSPEIEWEAPVAAVPEVVPDGPTEPRRQVLVVDDETDLRNMIAQYLQRLDYQVRSAADGTQALQLLQQELPQLIVLDAMLPGVHGFEICYRVKHSEATKHIPVIMISAIYRGAKYAEDVKRMYGADGYLEKPFRLDQLKQQIEANWPQEAPALSGPESAELANRLLQQAAVVYRQGNPQEAVRFLEQAVAAAPFSTELQRRLALLLDQTGDPHRALSAHEKVAELEPTFENLEELAKAYERGGFTKKAHATWERCFWLCEDKAAGQTIRQHMDKLKPAGG